MNRIRRAWAVLRAEWQAWFPPAALLASLRASLDDARAEVTRLSAQAKRKEVAVREAHALLATAITDDRGPTQ